MFPTRANILTDWIGDCLLLHEALFLCILGSLEMFYSRVFGPMIFEILTLETQAFVAICVRLFSLLYFVGVMNSRIRETIRGRGWFRRTIFNERGYAALYIASHRGHAGVVSKLMSLNIQPCRKMPSGRSAIHVAVYKRRVTCVNLLVGGLKYVHLSGLTDSCTNHYFYDNCRNSRALIG